MGDLITQLEEDARRRFVHWDQELWQGLLTGAARQLAEALTAAAASEAEARLVIGAYLKLCAEGIGRGYLFPPAVGTNFFTLVFLTLIPRDLAGIAIEQRARVMTQCFNLGENLESSPLWLRRIFLRLAADRIRLDQLEQLVAEVTRQAIDQPAVALGAHPRSVWISLADADRRFLPGAMHFVSPTVLCVHDRLRTGEGETIAQGVWLADPPLALGVMGCADAPKTQKMPAAWLGELERADPRIAEILASTHNDWRGACSLAASQFIIGLLPA
ncbi:MAG: hypothetical protein MUF51_05465 [Vicinamibacteria bacterium]|nr:hypothetical protein [Vicinamibacteria bacterium]